jgi:hypothetical protein
MRLAVLTMHRVALQDVDGNPMASSEIFRCRCQYDRWEMKAGGTWLRQSCHRALCKLGVGLCVYMQPEQHKSDEATLCHTSLYTMTFGYCRLEERLELSAVVKQGYGFHQVRREICNGELVKETSVPYCVEGFNLQPGKRRQLASTRQSFC